SCTNVNRSLIKNGRRHLRSNRALPDQTVKAQFIAAQIAGEGVRSARNVSWTNRFVCVLRVFLRTIMNSLLGQVSSAILLADKIPHLRERCIGNSRRVGSHVGNQTD